MPEARLAKLFRNGASQAVRLPAEFRFEGHEVYATRDDSTGDVVLSARPGASAWRAFFADARTGGTHDDFMADRPLNTLPRERELFSDKT